MAVEPIAAQHATRQVALARRAAIELAQLWRLVDPASIAASWTALLPQALALLGTSQAVAAAAAGTYIDDALEAQGMAAAAAGRINPGAFAGVASDGRPLASLLLQPAGTALDQLRAGASPARAMSSGLFTLDLIARTQVADAGRTADGVAITARPEVRGYVRMIVGKTCSRCLILAGRRYEWNQGFRRHPRCDCRHIPVAEAVPDDVRVNPQAHFDSLSKTEQDELLGKDGAQAVRDGADMAKVVNARRGMVAAADGRLYTTEAAGRRPRLMPEQIYREAGGSRDEAVRLLRLHRFII